MPGPAPDNTHPPPPRSQNFGVGVLVAITLLGLALLIALNPNGFEPKTVRIPYSPTFLEQVRAGNVSAISSKSATVSGTFRTPVRYPSDATTPASAFVTVIPEFANSSALMALLQSKGVEISATAPSTGTSPLLTLLLFFGPVVLIVLLFVWLRRSGGVGGAAAFGRSRAQRVEPSGHTVDFDDVAGIDEAKAELTELVDFLKDPDKYRRLGGRIPRGVLLTGPPGTGKTLLARALAGEARVPFFSISASEFVEMFVGVGASRVRDLFKQAKEAAPAIVFVDELDAIGRSRAGAMGGFGGGHDEREQTLNQILTEMDGFDPSVGVIVIAATNRPEVLDPALLRPGRFDRRVAVQPPDTAGRRKILDVHTRSVPLAGDVDLDRLAATTPGMVGADLANIVNEAALTAARRGHDVVTMSDLHDSLEKLVLGSERRILMSEEERRRTAYHEAGHALIGMLTPGADPVRKVSIIPRGIALGITFSAPDADRFSYDRPYLLGKIKVALGGRVAEELVYDEVTTGAQNDIKQATELARNMVGLWGMSHVIGPVTVIPDEGQLPFPGASDVSPQTQQLIDEEVRHLIDDAHEQVTHLMSANRQRLDSLVEALLEQETLEQDEAYAAAGIQAARETPALM
ncbi:MAG TPA: ATP-dependent zinc metalloprotease FtsH [Solirubrobacteraceae bacterium]|nr:ATP-dependent zinc metalloprotease FtsH [Solirubrobacteraceae bacterium]